MTPTTDASPKARNRNDWSVVQLPRLLFYLTIAVSVPAVGFLVFLLATD